MTASIETPALTGTWNVDPSHSRLGFAVRHAMVATVRGKFNDVSGVLVLDGENPADSSAEVTAQIASFDTGSADRDGHVKSADFFDAEQWPTLTFKSTSARSAGEDEYVLSGDLTIRDVTRPIDLAISYIGASTDPYNNARAGFEGTAVLNRKDFGLTWNSVLETGGVLVGDKVKITIDVSAIKAA